MTMEDILARLAQESGAPHLSFNVHGVCTLDLGDRLVHLEHDPADGSLALHTEVTVLPSPRDPAVLERLLTANYFTLQTAGATLGLQGSSGQVVLFRRMPCMGLDYESFNELLDGFVEAADWWRAQLGDGLQVQPQSEGPGSGLPGVWGRTLLQG